MQYSVAALFTDMPFSAAKTADSIYLSLYLALITTAFIDSIVSYNYWHKKRLINFGNVNIR